MTLPYHQRLAAHLANEIRVRAVKRKQTLNLHWTGQDGMEFVTIPKQWSITLRGRDNIAILTDLRHPGPGHNGQRIRLQGPEARDTRMILATITQNGHPL